MEDKDGKGTDLDKNAEVELKNLINSLKERFFLFLHLYPFFNIEKSIVRNIIINAFVIKMMGILQRTKYIS